MTTGRRTRSEVADEAMEVALRVAALDGVLEAQKACLKGPPEKGFETQKRALRP